MSPWQRLVLLVVACAALASGGLAFRNFRDGHRADMLRAAMARHTPEEPYLVVNRAHDSLDVRQGSRLLMRAPCASGSGKVLTARWQTWKFTSPRGRLSVLKKVVDPIWTKPAWAFIEENERMPTSPLDPARFDSTAMGEYGLHLGDGFLIHGTIYPVVPLDTETHGCVRLESDPLATVFETAVVGTPVYFY